MRNLSTIYVKEVGENLRITGNSDREYIEFETFEEAVDEFFSTIEAQKIDVQR